VAVAETSKRTGAIRATLRHSDFRFLIAGQTISQTGDWLYSVALIVYVLDKTGSGAWVAATSVIRFAPFVVLSTLGGVIADRYDRKQIMVLTDLGRAATMVAMAAAAAAEAPALVVIALAAISTALATPYFPAVGAATPALVGEDDLTAANTIIAAISNVTLALGPAVGGLVLALSTPITAFTVNAVTFLASAVLTWKIKTNLVPRESSDGGEAAPSFGSRLAEGFRAITSSGEVVLLLVVTLAFAVFYGQEIVLYSLAATERLGLGDAGIGYLFAATGIGGILAAGLTGRISDRSRQGGILAISAILSAVPMMIIAVVTSPVVAYALLLVEGVGFILGDVIGMTMLQRLLPGDLLGRVLGVLDSLMVAGIIVGSVLAPVLVEVAGLEVALVIGGGVLALAGVLVLPKARGIDRRTAERFERLAPKVELLERVGMFETASRQVLEALAESAVDERVAAGTTVIRQGDEPEDLYVVAAGRLDVTSSGEQGGSPVRIAELGPGDCFGEIGLLRRIPRTATVTALENCDLLRISGEDFLRVVNEGAGLSTSFKAGVARRLAATHPMQEQGSA
jgi:MFS family permease